jgi:hypothetical protein
VSTDRAGSPPQGVGREQLRDLLAKGWLTHDGMWFDQTARAFGLEQANRLNRAAIRAMAPFEVGRLCGALGVAPVELTDADAVARFVAAGITLVTPASVAGRLRVWTAGRRLHWEWDPGECFAYKGMERFGYLAGYECGVIYRIECWLEALGVRPLEEPAVGPCVMRAGGECAGSLELPFG